MTTIVLLLVMITVFSVLAEVTNAQDDMKTEWALIVDAGSSGTRMRIFRWSKDVDISKVPQIVQFFPSDPDDQKLLEVHPGISSFANNVTMATEQISELIEQAKRWIPEDHYEETNVRLGTLFSLSMIPHTSTHTHTNTHRRNSGYETCEQS
jgi:apyrase